MNVHFVNLSYLGNVTSVLGGVNDSVHVANQLIDNCIHFDNDGTINYCRPAIAALSSVIDMAFD